MLYLVVWVFRTMYHYIILILSTENSEHSIKFISTELKTKTILKLGKTVQWHGSYQYGGASILVDMTIEISAGKSTAWHKLIHKWFLFCVFHI